MFDRLEIYPYQRMEEQIPHREERRRIAHAVPKIKIDMNRVFNAQTWNRLSQEVSSLIKLENLLLVGGAIILSRAFILGELLPFIFAFVAVFAAGSRKRSIILLLSGLLGFATVLSGRALLIDTVTIITLLLVLNSIKLPSEKNYWGIPMITLAVVLLVKSIAVLINGVDFYQEMIIVFEAMISSIIAFVFLNCNQVIKERKAMTSFSFEEMAAFMVLGIGLIMGLNDVHLAGLAVSGILCRLGIMIAAYLWGTGGGAIMGVMSGILPSIASSVFAQTLGIYSISGLLAGAFRNFGKLGVIIGFMLGNLALSMFISESQLSILGMWETALASIIFFLLPESLKEKMPVQILGPVSALKAVDFKTMDNHIKETVGNRIHHLAQVFDELSSTFTGQENLSGSLRSDTYLNYLYDELSHGFCEGCTRFNSCWDRDCYSTSQEMLDLFSIIEREGQLNYEECPSAFKRRCVHGRELITTINYLFDNLRVNEYWSEKMDESRELVARQLKGVSQVVRNLAEEIDIETVVDLQLRDDLLKASKRMGINLKDITPLRGAGDQIYLTVTCGSCVDGSGCELSIAPALSTVMGGKLEVCNKKCPRPMGKGACEFTLTRAFNYKVNSAVVQVAREEVSGDSLKVITLKEGKELVVLSDGMGVGAKACEQSSTAVKLLEDLLDSGFNKELALKTINSVLLLRSRTETFTTMDMVMIDLYTGDVDFIKTASAPSFIKRARKVQVISSSSLPMGILDEVEVASEKRTLLPQDIILMVSDGVIEVSREQNGEMWISRLLSEISENDPKHIAQLVINRALTLAKGKPTDDMTVICLQIELA